MLAIVIGLIWMTSFFISLVEDVDDYNKIMGEIEESREELEKLKEEYKEWNRLWGKDREVEKWIEEVVK